MLFVPLRGKLILFKREQLFASNISRLIYKESFLVNKQLDAHFFFRVYLFQFSTCFEHPCAHHQENQLY